MLIKLCKEQLEREGVDTLPKTSFKKIPFNEVALRKLPSWSMVYYYTHAGGRQTKSVKCDKSYWSTVPRISSIYLVDFGC